jgi:hypothetical protein
MRLDGLSAPAIQGGCMSVEWTGFPQWAVLHSWVVVLPKMGIGPTWPKSAAYHHTLRELMQ